MTIRLKAASDLGKIIKRDGWPLRITAPSGVSTTLVGLSNDIAQLIDPDTGQAVSGRSASVAIFTADLAEACLGLPQGIADSKVKPWIVEFDDIHGSPYKFKVAQSNPDRTIGLVTCLLELYK